MTTKHIFGLFLFVFFTFIVPIQSQTLLHIKNGCHFDGDETPQDIYGYDPSNEAVLIINRITAAIGLEQNYIIKAANVSNALACTEGGQRYVLYRTTFIEKFKRDARTQWAAYCVLAHEIGHHLNNHNFTESDPKRRKILELAADRFAGNVLQKMGATLDEAQAGINTFSLAGENNTHPATSARLEAVASGWKQSEEGKKFKVETPQYEPPAKVVFTDFDKSRIVPITPTVETTSRTTKSDFIETATGVSFTMKFITGNSFQMGSNEQDDEKPIHTVSVGNFFMSKYEVTFDEYDKFCDATSRAKPSDHGWGRGKRPVINVCWDDATAYCVWLSKKTGKKYRLPTEAEWEYSAKGGQSYKYAGSDNVKSIAWIDENSGSKTHNVGELQANGFGLYDMSGNVWEWCSDSYEGYPGSVSKSEPRPTGRVTRGGSWGFRSADCRLTNRHVNIPTLCYFCIGFRVCLTFF